MGESSEDLRLPFVFEETKNEMQASFSCAGARSAIVDELSEHSA